MPSSTAREAPTVVLPPSSPPSSADAEDELSIEIQNEPDGSYVTFPELLRIVRRVHPEARANWDGLLGVLRLEAAGHNLQALSERPVLVVDGRTLAMSKALRLRDSVVLVPAGTVNEVFRALDFDFQLPGAMAEARPAASSPAPGNFADVASSSEVGSGARPGAMSPGASLLPDIAAPAMPQLDLPQIGDSVSGLTWAELTDYSHPREPRRMTIVHDAPFGALAEAVSQLSRRTGELQVTLVEVEGRRDDPALVAQVARSRPEVLLDLVSRPGEKDRRFEIWTVHEALWTPRSGAGGPEARSILELYAPHQFHNLALGSMLRAEFSRGFPEGTVRMELAPCYLLRRVDAPSVAILIPEQLVTGDEREMERIARAVGGGFAGYSMGLRSATR